MNGYQTAMIDLPLMVREPRGQRCMNPEIVAGMCADLEPMAQESMHVLTLDRKNRLIRRHMVTLGIADASLVHPREIFRAAISDNACRLIMVHNHPSGDPSPSAEDIRITRRMVEAGVIMGIGVVDHVIVGTDGRYSMRESGIVEFKEV